MQKNEAGFKMSFKKRNPDFRKPPKKIAAAIPATGDLRKHDQPKRAVKNSNDMETSSSSEEDVLEKTRKTELENQKSEQAKMVEMALLEQVMSGQIDVMDLLKSGQVDSTSLKEKLQKQMQNIDGVPTSATEPTAAPAPVSAPASPPSSHKQAAYNPLMRNRDSSNPPTSQKQKSDSKVSKSKRKKATGSISSESSESSSDDSIDTDISSESDSDEDSHKLAKKVKKLKAKNKKLQKKVKTLKKKLKEKKSEKKDEKQVKSLQRNAHGQIEGTKVPPRPQPPPQPQAQATGALAPMTPQQYSSQQSQVRRQYDPQTGQYRDAPETMLPAPPGPMPSGMLGMPPFPPMPPLGQMPAMPPISISSLPMSSGPLPRPPSSNLTGLSTGPMYENEVMEIKNVRGNSPINNYPSNDDLYLDVFKEKEKQKPKSNKNTKTVQMSGQHFPNSNSSGQRPIESLNRSGQFQHQRFQQQAQYHQQPQKTHATQDLFEKKNKVSHHERGYKPSSNSSDDSESEQEGPPKVDPRKRKSSDRGEVVVRSTAAKNLIKDFYEEEEVAVVAAEGDMPPLIESAAGKNTRDSSARGVTYSGKCIFCNFYHTVTAKSENASLCPKGRQYLEKYKTNERQIQDLRTSVKVNTDKLVSLKNKRELMAKVIVENDVRKNERAKRMEGYRKHIESLPMPVKVSQEFGRKVVKAQNNQQTLGNQLQAAIDRGNSATHSEEQKLQEYDELDGHTIQTDDAPSSSYSRPGSHKSRRHHEPRRSSESDFTGRKDEGYSDAQFDDIHYGRRQTSGEHRQVYEKREPLRDQHSLRDRSPVEPPSREQYWRNHHPEDPLPRSREPTKQHLEHKEHSGRPPFENLRTSPRPTFRSPVGGLLKTPAAAGPPQRPPPALLRTPGSRPQYLLPGERDPRQHSSYSTARPPYGWSGEQGR